MPVVVPQNVYPFQGLIYGLIDRGGLDWTHPCRIFVSPLSGTEFDRVRCVAAPQTAAFAVRESMFQIKIAYPSTAGHNWEQPIMHSMNEDEIEEKQVKRGKRSGDRADDRHNPSVSRRG